MIRDNPLYTILVIIYLGKTGRIGDHGKKGDLHQVGEN